MTGSDLKLIGLRGSTTCPVNSVAAIESAVASLIDAMMEHNGLNPDQIVSLTFSVTADLDACFRPRSPVVGRAGMPLPCSIVNRWLSAETCLAASDCLPTSGCPDRDPATPISKRPACFAQTDSVTTDSWLAGSSPSLPGMVSGESLQLN